MSIICPVRDTAATSHAGETNMERRKMCRMASFIVTKTKVFWSQVTDSHEDIITEFELQHLDDNCNTVGIVRVEITPPEDDFSASTDRWIFSTDQDIIPDWYDPAHAERDCRIALGKWHQFKIISDKCNVNSGTFIALGNATVEAYGNATVRAWGNATVEAYGNATVEASDNATVRAYGNATVEAWGNATVRASDNATVRAYGNATVEAYGNATIQKHAEGVTYTLSGLSVCIDRTRIDQVTVEISR